MVRTGIATFAAIMLAAGVANATGIKQNNHNLNLNHAGAASSSKNTNVNGNSNRNNVVGVTSARGGAARAKASGGLGVGSATVNNNPLTITSATSGDSSSDQGQLQLQTQKQKQKSSQRLQNSVGSFTEDRNSIEIDDHSLVEAPDIPVATAYAPSMQATAPCRVAWSAGGQAMTFGVTGGGSVLDEGCDDRELARSLNALASDMIEGNRDREGYALQLAAAQILMKRARESLGVGEFSTEARAARGEYEAPVELPKTTPWLGSTPGIRR